MSLKDSLANARKIFRDEQESDIYDRRGIRGVSSDVKEKWNDKRFELSTTVPIITPEIENNDDSAEKLKYLSYIDLNKFKQREVSTTLLNMDDEANLVRHPIHEKPRALNYGGGYMFPNHFEGRDITDESDIRYPKFVKHSKQLLNIDRLEYSEASNNYLSVFSPSNYVSDEFYTRGGRSSRQ